MSESLDGFKLIFREAPYAVFLFEPLVDVKDLGADFKVLECNSAGSEFFGQYLSNLPQNFHLYDLILMVGGHALWDEVSLRLKNEQRFQQNFYSAKLQKWCSISGHILADGNLLIHLIQWMDSPQFTETNSFASPIHSSYREEFQNFRKLLLKPEMSLEEFLHSLLEYAKSEINADSIGLWKLDDERDQLVCISAITNEAIENPQNCVQDLGVEKKNFLEILFKDRQLVVADVADFETISFYQANFFHSNEIVSFIHTSFQRGSFLKGILSIGKLNPYSWTKEEIEFCDLLTDLVSDALVHNKLLEREARLKAIVNLLPDLIFLLDENSRFIDISASNRNDLLLPSENFIGKLAAEVLPDDLARLTQQMVKETLSTMQPQSAEYELVIDGSLRQFEARYVPAGQRRVLSIVRNISESVFAKKELSRLQNLQKLVFQVAIDYIHIESSSFDKQIHRMLELIGKEISMDHAFLLLNKNSESLLDISYQWHASVGTDFITNPNLSIDLFQEYDAKLTSEEIITIDLTSLPLSSKIRRALEPFGINFLLVSILNDVGKGMGYFCLANDYLCKSLDTDESWLLRMVSRILTNAFISRRNEDSLKESELQYREMQNLFRKIADNLVDWLWVKDKDMKYIFVNKALCENYLGITDIEQAIGQKNSFFIELQKEAHRENPQYFTLNETSYATDAKVLETGKPIRYMNFGNVRGKYMYLDIIKSPLVDEEGNVVAIIGSARDITEQKRFELIQNLQFRIVEAATRFSDFQEFIETFRKELGKIMDCSNLFVAFYNPSTQQFSSPYFKDDYDGFQSWPAEGTLSGYVINLGEAVLLKKQDIYELASQGIIQMIGTPAEVWMGIPLEVEGVKEGVMVVQNYTNPDAYSKEDLELFRKISYHLSLALHRKKAEQEIRDALNKVLESEKLKVAFFQNMSHEIRTPLNGILGFANILLEGNVDTSQMRLYIEGIEQSGLRLLQLLTDILDLTRLDAGMETLHISSFSPDSLLTDLIEQFSTRALEKGLMLQKTQIDPNLLWQSDEEKLKNILQHLLDNAIKFSAAGTISLGFIPEKRNLKFFVKDDGVGIPSDKLQKIFDRFYQIDFSMSRGHEGAGLGLSVCKAMIELLGGQIWVESQHGKGSVFYFTIPFVPLQSTDSLEPENQVQKPLPTSTHEKNCSILVVEDEPSNYAYMEVLLHKLDMKIYHAWDAREALQILNQHSDIFLIFMDIRLPDIDGLKLTSLIKQKYPNIPVIGTSAYAMASDREKALLAGCDDYLIKPLRAQQIKSMVQNYLDML